MRVLMVHNRFGGTTRGGAERVVERLADALRARGHAVDVAVIRAPNIVSFDRLGTRSAPLRAVWHLVDLLNIVAAVRLRRLLRRTKPDIVHTHNLIGCGGLTPWMLRRSGISWVHTLHDVQLITPSGMTMHDVPSTPMERSMFGRWFRVLRRRLFGSPTIVTSPSAWLLQLHRGHQFFLGARDAVVLNPTDTMVAAPRRRGAVRTFSFIGQVEGAKGIVVLVEAFRQLAMRYPDIALHVIGDGRAIPALKRIARDCRGLVLRGRLDGDGVRAALAHADVLVVPSLIDENQPSAILEAYAAGVPVVASRVGGIPEIVRDGETGFLVDAGSVEDLLLALRSCMDEPEQLSRMAQACQAFAAVHAPNVIAEQIETLYTAAREHHYGERPRNHRDEQDESVGQIREE